MRKLLAPLSEVNRRAHVAIWGGTVLLTVYLYRGNHSFFTHQLASLVPEGPFAEWYAHGYQFLAAFALLLLLPCLWIRVGTNESLADHGLCVGDWRFGLKFLGLAMLALALPLYVNAGSPEFQAEYPLAGIAGRSVRLFLLWELCYLVYYVAWEFFFRGFWQIGGFKRGLKVGDIIVAVDGQPVTNAAELDRVVMKSRLGDDLSYSVIRGRQETEFTIPVSLFTQRDYWPFLRSSCSWASVSSRLD